MDIEQAQGEAGKTAPARQVGTAISSRGLARRNFTRAGIGASGVLLTLVSQSGMATAICRSPSGSLSGTLQSHAPAPICSGVKPAYYSQNASAWPAGTASGTVFSSVFSVKPGTQYAADSTTFGSLLSGDQGVDPSSLGMYMVTTYLNIMSGRISFLTVAQLMQIWNELQSPGYYTPTAGVTWDVSQVVTYLSGTAS